MADYYVDPALGSDTGDGTKVLPWGRASGSVVQYALNTGIASQGSTGDAIHILAGSTENLGGTAWSLTSYGTPTFDQPLYIGGYSEDEYDGGRATIDIGGADSLLGDATNYSFLVLADMDVEGRSDAGWMLDLGSDCFLYRLTFDCESTAYGMHLTWRNTVLNCSVFNSASKACLLSSSTQLINCYLEGNAGDAAVQCDGSQGILQNCVIITPHTTGGGLYFSADSWLAHRCTIVNSAGSNEYGFYTAGGSEGVKVIDCYFEGWSVSGGAGILIASGATAYAILNNRFFDCDTNISNSGKIFAQSGNSSLPSSGISNLATEDFRPTIDLKGEGIITAFQGLSGNALKFDIGAVPYDKLFGYRPFGR